MTSSSSSSSFRSDPSFYSDDKARESKRSKAVNALGSEDGSAQQQAQGSSTDCNQGQRNNTKHAKDSITEPLALTLGATRAGRRASQTASATKFDFHLISKADSKKMPEVVVEPSCSPYDKVEKAIGPEHI